ncbi:MAG: STAS domain-containing protein [Spongiibacteraceae bacterium]|nr:STAS domain-containing protein [Spongiibacteraceae bacterium]
MATNSNFTCGSALDIANVNTLLARLNKTLEKTSTITIKADKITKCDTAGLQLFIALKQEISQTGGQLIWKKPSEALINSAKLLGLDQALGLSD